MPCSKKLMMEILFLLHGVFLKYGAIQLAKQNIIKIINIALC
jgi:hypothetical protein